MLVPRDGLSKSPSSVSMQLGNCWMSGLFLLDFSISIFETLIFFISIKAFDYCPRPSITLIAAFGLGTAELSNSLF